MVMANQKKSALGLYPLTIRYFPGELHRIAKIRAAEEGALLGDLLVRAVAAGLSVPGYEDWGRRLRKD